VIDNNGGSLRVVIDGHLVMFAQRFAEEPGPPGRTGPVGPTGLVPPHIWTWPVVLTLCLALLALAVSGGSLCWQITSWRRSGPQLTVRTINGIGGTPPSGVWFVGVEVTNSGRLGTQVEQFGFQLPNGNTIQNIYDFLGQPVQFPVPLAPGQTASMRYRVDHIREILREQGLSGDNVRPFAQTGHGRVEGPAEHLGERIQHLP